MSSIQKILTRAKKQQNKFHIHISTFILFKRILSSIEISLKSKIFNLVALNDAPTEFILCSLMNFVIYFLAIFVVF